MSHDVWTILRSRLILIPILLLAAIVRFHAIGAQSLWTDEFVSLQLACGRGAVVDTLPRDNWIDHPIAPTQLRDAFSIWRIYTHAMEQDTHPPLYPMVLRCWITCFGEEAVTARTLAAIASLLAVWLLYETVRETNGPSAGAWAAAILAAAAAQVEFAQVVRSYSMLIALVLACCWVGVRIEKFGASIRRCMALGALMFLAMLTHYYAAPPLLALAIYLVLRLRFRVRIVITFLSAAILFLLIWGYGIWNQHQHFSSNMQWILEDRNGNLTRTLLRAGSQGIYYLLPAKRPQVLTAIGGAVVLFLPMLAIRRRPGVLLWVLILLLSIAVVMTTDLIRSSNMLDYLRYTAVGSAAICAALVIFLQAFAGRHWQVAAAVILIAELLSLTGAYEFVRPDFRGMASIFADRISPRDALVIFQPPKLAWGSDILYDAAMHYARQPPGGAIILTHPADDATLARLRAANQIWILNSSGDDAQHLIPGFEIAEAHPVPPMVVVESGTLK